MYDVHHKRRYRELPVAVTLYTYQFGEQAVGEEPNAWGYSWYPNLHDSLELLLMERGCVHWIIGEQEFDPVPGDLLVVNPFELHASTMKATDSVAVYYLIHIDLDEYPHALGKTASDPLRKVLSGELAFQTFFPAADVRATAACIREMHEEFSRGGDSPAGQCRIQSLVFALLGELLEHCHPTNRSGSDLRRYAFMNEVEKYITVSFHREDLSTEEIAAAMNYSTAHFGRLFRECYGTGFQRYLRSWRIRRAAWYPEYRALAISEIAEAVGFRDYNYFSRAFKQELGLTPTEWYARRRSIKGQVPFKAE